MSEPGRFFIGAMRLVPKSQVSRAVRRLAQVRSKFATQRFAKRYGISLDEAERNLDEYETILDLFTRRLKPGLRPLDPDPRALLSPVDGRVLALGPVETGALYQAKGRTFMLQALLASEEDAARLLGGWHCTLYLAPKDYHRIHSPVTGSILGYTYVPGSLFPVNPAAVAHVDELFARNERLITHIDTERFGRAAIVKVGATCVGHIKLAYDDTVETNAGGGGQRIVRRTIYERPVAIERGAELGVFEMGSTVVVVTERPIEGVQLSAGDTVRVGMRLGVASSR